MLQQLAVKAGDDLSCGTEYAALVDAVHQGLIDEAGDQSVGGAVVYGALQAGTF